MACHARKSKLQLFRQTPPGPILSLVAASDMEFSCALISTGVRKPWHPCAQVRGRTDQDNTKHGKGTQSRHCTTCAFTSLMHLEKVLCGLFICDRRCQGYFVFTSFHLWISTTGLVSRSKLSCVSSGSEAAAEHHLASSCLSRHAKTLWFFLIKPYS